MSDLDSSQPRGGMSPDLGSQFDLVRLHKNTIRWGQSSQPLSAFVGRGYVRTILGVEPVSLRWPGSDQPAMGGATAETGLVLETGELVVELRIQLQPP